MNKIKTPMELGNHIVKDFYGIVGANDDYAQWVAEEVEKLMTNKTGLQDSNGKEIYFGQLIKIPVTINKEIHGNHSFYKVIRKGSVAVLSYVKSEKGQVVPEGYMSCLLTDKYRTEDLCLVSDISKLKPIEEIFIV